MSVQLTPFSAVRWFLPNPPWKSPPSLRSKAPEGEVRIDLRLARETVWLTQAQRVKLFGRDQSVISRHVRHVFADGELPVEGNMQKMHIASGTGALETGIRVSSRSADFLISPRIAERIPER